MDLDKIKSAIVLDDPQQALERLSGALKTSGTRLLGAEIQDGKVQVRTFQPTSARVKERMNDAVLRQKVEAIGLRWTDEMKGRAIPYWMSDERPDSHGDIVKQNWLFDIFDKNPVMVFSHNWGGLPVGNVVDKEVVKRDDADYKGPALFGHGLYAPRSVSEFADDVFKLVDIGFLRGNSVGFISDRVIDVKDEQEREELGLGRWGLILDQNHLLELSPTTLGANPGAHSVLATLAAAKARGQIDARAMNVIREISRRDALKFGSKDAAVTLDQRWMAYARALFPREQFAKMSDVEASLIDKDAFEKAKRVWVNVGIVTEDTDGDGQPDDAEEPADDKPAESDEEKAKVRAAVSKALADQYADEESLSCGVDTVMAKRAELLEALKGKPPYEGDDEDEEKPAKEADEAPPKTVEEKLDALAVMLEELTVSVGDSMGRMAQATEDSRAMLESLSEKLFDKTDKDSDPDGDDSSSVDAGASLDLGKAAAACAALDRVRLARTPA